MVSQLLGGGRNIRINQHDLKKRNRRGGKMEKKVITEVLNGL